MVGKDILRKEDRGFRAEERFMCSRSRRKVRWSKQTDQSGNGLA